RRWSLPVVWASWTASVAATATTSVTPSVSLTTPSPLRYPAPFPPRSHAATRSSKNLRTCTAAAASGPPRLARAIRYRYPVGQPAHLFSRSQARVVPSRKSALRSSDRALASGSAGELAAGLGGSWPPAGGWPLPPPASAASRPHVRTTPRGRPADRSARIVLA